MQILSPQASFARRVTVGKGSGMPWLEKQEYPGHSKLGSLRAGSGKASLGAGRKAQFLQRPDSEGHCQEDEKLPIKPRPTWPH